MSFFAGNEQSALEDPSQNTSAPNHMGGSSEYRIAEPSASICLVRSPPGRKKGSPGKKGFDNTEMFEDKFIDNILGTLHDVRQQGGGKQNPFAPSNDAVRNRVKAIQNNEWWWIINLLGVSLLLNSSSKPKRMLRGSRGGGVGSGGSAIVQRPGSGSTRRRKTRYDSQPLPGDPSNSSFQESMTLDPSHPSFERRENSVYQATTSSKIYPADFPEVREYMRWRVQRNKKRLRKLTSAASCIQKGFRSYMARTLIQRMRQERAALFVQRNWRGLMGRRRYNLKRKEEWAVRLLQRNWRGKAGRELYLAKTRGEQCSEHASAHIPR